MADKFRTLSIHVLVLLVIINDILLNYLWTTCIFTSWYYFSTYSFFLGFWEWWWWKHWRISSTRDYRILEVIDVFVKGDQIYEIGTIWERNNISYLCV